MSRTCASWSRRPSPWSTSTPRRTSWSTSEFVRPSDPVVARRRPVQGQREARLGAADELRGADPDDGRARPAGAQPARRASCASDLAVLIATIAMTRPADHHGSHAIVQRCGDDRGDAAQCARAGLPARRARRRRRRRRPTAPSTILERAGGVRFVSEPDRGLSHAMNKGVDDGRRFDRRLAQRRRRLPPRRAARRRRGLRGAARGRVGHRPLPDHRRRRARDPPRRDGLQELLPAPLLALALPDAELHLRAGDLRASRGVSAPSVPRGLRDVDGLRRLPPACAGRRPDRPRPRPGLLSHDGGHAFDVELRAPVRRARRAGSGPWRRTSRSRSPSTRR